MADANDKLFDKRVYERNIRKGLITSSQYDAYLKELPDGQGRSEVLDIKFGMVREESPTRAAPAAQPMVPEAAPPRSTDVAATFRDPAGMQSPAPAPAAPPAAAPAPAAAPTPAAAPSSAAAPAPAAPAPAVREGAPDGHGEAAADPTAAGFGRPATNHGEAPGGNASGGNASGGNASGANAAGSSIPNSSDALPTPGIE